MKKVILSVLMFLSVISGICKADNIVSAIDMKIVGDGITMNTEAIQKAIDYCHSLKNGGCLVFPEGVYRTGSIVLKSNVTIKLEKGAVISGSTDPYDYYALEARGGEAPGTVKNVTIRNMFVDVPFSRPDINYDMRGPAFDFFHNPIPSSITGIPGHCVENVTLENIEIFCPGKASKGMAYVPLSRLSAVPEKIDDYPEFTMFGELPSYGLYGRHVRGLKLNNVNFRLKDSDFRPKYIFDDVEGIKEK